MKEKLLAFIEKNPRCSFSEIEALFEREGYPYKGKAALKDPDRNALIWVGWKKEAFELICELVKAEKIVIIRPEE